MSIEAGAPTCPILRKLVGLLEADPGPDGGMSSSAFSRLLAEIELDAVLLNADPQTRAFVSVAREMTKLSEEIGARTAGPTAVSTAEGGLSHP